MIYDSLAEAVVRVISFTLYVAVMVFHLRFK